MDVKHIEPNHKENLLRSEFKDQCQLPQSPTALETASSGLLKPAFLVEQTCGFRTVDQKSKCVEEKSVPTPHTSPWLQGKRSTEMGEQRNAAQLVFDDGWKLPS